MENTYSELKKEYINKINELTEKCNDLSLLDLVYKIMIKSKSEWAGGNRNNDWQNKLTAS